jgi:hypothetical protein
MAKTGKRLYSTVSGVELVVVKGADVSLECAGAAMAEAKQNLPGALTEGAAVLLSKRYADEQTGLMVLCTRGGVGPLQVDGRELQLQATKALPSSD